MTLRTLNYGNYGIFLIMGNAGFLSINSITTTKISVAQRLPPPVPAVALAAPEPLWEVPKMGGALKFGV